MAVCAKKELHPDNIYVRVPSTEQLGLQRALAKSATHEHLKWQVESTAVTVPIRYKQESFTDRVHGLPTRPLLAGPLPVDPPLTDPLWKVLSSSITFCQDADLLLHKNVLNATPQSWIYLRVSSGANTSWSLWGCTRAVSNSLNPGNIRTKLSNTEPQSFFSVSFRVIMTTSYSMAVVRSEQKLCAPYVKSFAHLPWPIKRWGWALHMRKWFLAATRVSFTQQFNLH